MTLTLTRPFGRPRRLTGARVLPPLTRALTLPLIVDRRRLRRSCPRRLQAERELARADAARRRRAARARRRARPAASASSAWSGVGVGGRHRRRRRCGVGVGVGDVRRIAARGAPLEARGSATSPGSGCRRAPSGSVSGEQVVALLRPARSCRGRPGRSPPGGRRRWSSACWTLVTSNSTSSTRSDSMPPFGPGTSCSARWADGEAARDRRRRCRSVTVPLTPSPGRMAAALRTAWPVARVRDAARRPRRPGRRARRERRSSPPPGAAIARPSAASAIASDDDEGGGRAHQKSTVRVAGLGDRAWCAIGVRRPSRGRPPTASTSWSRAGVCVRAGARLSSRCRA